MPNPSLKELFVVKLTDSYLTVTPGNWLQIGSGYCHLQAHTDTQGERNNGEMTRNPFRALSQQTACLFRGTVRLTGTAVLCSHLHSRTGGLEWPQQPGVCVRGEGIDGKGL